MSRYLLSLPKIVRIASIIILAASLTACDGAEVRDPSPDERPNDDIPADPGTAPPPLATGPLRPTITLGEVDADNPSRIPLVVGGVSTRGAGPEAPLLVVDYTDENLTIVVDGVVQGKLIRPQSNGLKADIAFIVDNTSSMSNEIAGVRSSILAFLDALTDSGQDIAAGLVAFGDEMPDGIEPRIPSSDTRARAAVYDFVDIDADISMGSSLYRTAQELTATDPGTNTDFPELALAGVDFARRTFSWRSDAQRIYILITDDLTWGRGFSIPNRKGIDRDYFTAGSLGEQVRDEGSVIHVYSPAFPAESVTPPAYDVRTLADQTGGVWNELDRSGAFDLTELGIIETTLATSLVEFLRDDDTIQEREVRVHVRFQTDEQVYDGERTLRLSF
jgi:hypothetical protein